jgi:outer membrane lipoprotein SlyB
MQTPENTPRRRLHPLIAVAAAAVIVASLAATAAVTGLFPKAASRAAQNDQTQAAMIASQPVVDSSAPANPATYAPQQPHSAPEQTAGTPPPAATAAAPVAAPAQPQYAQQGAPSGTYAPPPASPGASCANCGVVVSIDAMHHEGRGTGIGAVGGAVAGGLVGNQFGAGTGRLAMTVLGAVGGGFAGNSVEKHLRSTTTYTVHVRMANGRYRYFTYRDAPPFQRGEHVHIAHGTLAAG